MKAAVDRTKCELIREAYGLTETSPVTQVMPLSMGTKYPGSIGQCLRISKDKVVDPETNVPLPPNTEGEMWINGLHIMEGYLNNPEATRSCITEDGRFKTGDIGKPMFSPLYLMSKLVSYTQPFRKEGEEGREKENILFILPRCDCNHFKIGSNPHDR